MQRAAAFRFARAAALILAACAAPGLVPAARAGDKPGPPKIRTVSPTGAPRGSTVDVTIEGANLYPIDDVFVGVADIGAALQPGNGEFKLVVRLTIPDTATPGPIAITVKTKEGAVKTEKFVVRLRLPVVTKVVPAVVHRGATVDMTLTGSLLGFPGYDTKVTADAGITAERGAKSTATSLLLKVAVPMTAPAGPHALIVETVDGRVSVPFTVLLSPPTLASVTPATVARGSAPVLVLAGTNLVAASPPSLAVPDSTVRLAPSGETTMTGVSVQATVLPDAAIGPRLLVVQTPDGVATIRFTVTGTPPRALVVQPVGAPRGGAVDAKMEGEAVPADAEWRFVPEDAGVRIERTPGGARKIVVAADAKPGPRTLVAVTRDGAATVPFAVVLRPPAVAGVVPSEVAPGAEATIALEGQNLDGTTLSLVEADGVEAAPGATSKSGIRVKVAADARPGPRAILVRGPDGAAIGRFVVPGPAASAPALESATPGRVPRGRPTQVVLGGINLSPAGGGVPSIAARGADDAPLPVKVVSAAPNRIVVEVSPPAAGALGGGAIVVKTPEGTAVVALSVDPALPSIAGVTPTAFARPGDAEIAITGKGLGGAPAPAPRVVLVPARGGAEVVASVVSHAPDRVVAKATLPPDAASGAWLVVVTTEEGGAAAAVTVDPAAPAVASIEPRSVGVPATLEIAVAGKNLLEPDGKPPKVAVTRVGSSSNVEARVLKSSAEGLTVQVRTPAGSLAGPHLLVVKTADGSAAAVLDVVNAPPPAVAGIDAAEGGRLTNVMTTIRGSGFTGAVEVEFDGEGVKAVILPGGSDKELLVRITVAKDAAVGPRPFRIVAPGGVSPAGEKSVFTVK